MKCELDLHRKKYENNYTTDNPLAVLKFNGSLSDLKIIIEKLNFEICGVKYYTK